MVAGRRASAADQTFRSSSQDHRPKERQDQRSNEDARAVGGAQALQNSLQQQAAVWLIFIVPPLNRRTAAHRRKMPPMTRTPPATLNTMDVAGVLWLSTIPPSPPA